MVKIPDPKLFFSDKNINRLQFLCLDMACAMIFLLLVAGTGIHFLTIILRLGLLGSSILFFAVSYIDIRRHHRGYPCKIAVLMVAWFLLVQLIHLAKGNISHQYTQFLPVYFLALPFAAITFDSNRQIGLTRLSVVYLSIFLIWVFYTVLLLHDRVPQFLPSLIVWDGPRLSIHTHPNICARGFMIGISLSLGLSFKTSRTWAKFLLWIAAALLFVCLSLTNSRSTILVTGLLIGGIIFFRIYKGGWIQLAVGIVLVFTITISLFQVSQALFQWNQQRLINSKPAVQYTVSAEQPSVKEVTLSADSVPTQTPAINKHDSPGVSLATVSEKTTDAPPATLDAGSSTQHTLSQDIFTLNSRTRIWSSAIKHILENPSILIWGSPTAKFALDKTTHVHTHNSWLEVLMRLGLPGFVICLIFTWQAFASSLILLCSRRADLWKKNISLLALCILVSGIVEPCLFFTTILWNFVDFFFFLCLGYMQQWVNQIRAR